MRSWLEYISKNLSPEDYFSPMPDFQLGFPNPLYPPFITAIYDLVEPDKIMIIQDYKDELMKKAKFLITHDIIDHIYNRQATTTLSDKTNFVVNGYLVGEDGLFSFYYPTEDPKILLENTIAFAKSTRYRSSISHDLFRSFAKSYKNLTQYVDKFTTIRESLRKNPELSPYKMDKIATNKTYPDLLNNPNITQEYNMMLRDFRKWLVWRGASKRIRMENAYELIKNMNGQEAHPDIAKMKRQLKEINKLYFGSDKSAFESYESLNKAIDELENTELPKGIDPNSNSKIFKKMSQDIIRIFEEDWAKKMVLDFAEENRPKD